MRRMLVLTAAALALFAAPSWAQTHVDAGISIADGDLRGFYLAIGNYYHVPENEVTVIHERAIPDDEIPVVLFIAERARVAPEVVIDMRLRGLSWYAVGAHFGLGPDIYYVPVTGRIVGPPYGRAYGFYRGHARREWRRMRLEDADIVNLVNLRFASEAHHVPAVNVIRMREHGENFVAIHRDADRGRGRDQAPSDRGHGRGGSHGHGAKGADKEKD